MRIDDQFYRIKMKSVYFIGIKGVAMTALAIVAKERGYQVIGSDVEESFPTEEVLKKYKITPLPGFKEENITKLPQKPDLVVVTGAHGGSNNPEAKAARQLGIKTLMHAPALAEFLKEKKVIAVSGSHGKTTVAALIAHLLIKAGMDPSFAVGCGKINSLKTPAHDGKGQYFVVEADEYMTDPGIDPTPRFFYLEPEIAVITNIEFDHPDAYFSLAEVKEAFLTFAGKIKKEGLLITAADQENVREIIPKIKKKIYAYGLSFLADFQIWRVSYGLEQTFFNLKFKGLDLGQFMIRLAGLHNVYNAVAALAVGNQVGLSWEQMRQDLKTFAGTKRRFEKIREKNGVVFYDDYAHHPTQIEKTIKACREWYPQNRLIVIFQPHTYSRTKALLEEFSRSFNGAQKIIILPIYSSAREKPDPEISSPILVRKIKQNHTEAVFLEAREKVVEYLQEILLPGDVVITMGAGDVYKLHDNF